jgi:hypothetical protein
MAVSKAKPMGQIKYLKNCKEISRLNGMAMMTLKKKKP